MAETQEFEVAPDTIYHAIFAQAGSLAKAVVEAVQNSYDSKSSKVSIEIDRKTIRVTDDGRGFQSRQEIDSRFKAFGFSHEGLGRQFGRFGLGRGQLWSFCSTVWHTGTFSMDVNVKARGLKYLLDDNLPYVQGVEIVGNFYEPMRTLEVQAFVREFSEIVKYAPLPVYVNGRLVNPDAASQIWDHETEDAYIRVTEGSTLAVYNMGIFVREYGAYVVGCGGVVVTKPGKGFEAQHGAH